jgi:hypothetical protein
VKIEFGGQASSRLPMVALAGVFALVGGTAVVAAAASGRADHRPQQVATDLSALRDHLIASAAAGGGWTGCGSEPEARAALATEAPSADCWSGTGRTPACAEAAYWIVVSPRGFEIHAVTDLDHDGAVAEWVATRESGPQRWTPPEVQ